ncbi:MULTISPECIES: ribonuclease P protein component [unclassified Frigoribacterium]|uniref:ribonuclease P protein component n=1 Tax=unclassified Frigoribacterium TaxID=2627005 RepID=UPI000F486A2E|nr:MULTISPECIES: ribonuclease P protein component [unclassified Frigoribacterium]MBD8582962.1 ribonuclease P protein component [Frigoribacterium sp. CFBP 8766]MBD8611278.1 ribonuclease P protein component [Frigoribacterium sp. CFBP 13729]MBF4580761.1 ribonuclease P protein component [Frigoribacterium sp. VKM Ac-2530]ROP75045.1 ribonuclease P protein component [Frigoribacterium sp. PhB107]TDT62108.1 ribonuclease P protein component [Frigoribacterium sp. PhB116]
MLARANRIVRADDYRNTVRRGRKSGTAHSVVYVRRRDDDLVRFGFIVAKTVGNAVARNTVRRRLKHVCHDILPGVPPGTDVVVRALPGSLDVPWSTLLRDISGVVDKVVGQ